MTSRFASVLFALALPLVAQTPAQNPAPAAAEADNLFYKGYYLRAKNDLAGAMDLFQRFLDAAPDSKHAPEAADLQVRMLDQTGKSKERDAFKEKYAAQLAKAPKGPAPGERPAGGDAAGGGERPQPGAGGDRRAGGGQGRPGMAGFGLLYGDKKIADMTAEELTQVKEALAGSSRQIERMKQNGQEEQAKKMETNVEALKKALDANKTEDAQKALDTLRADRPARGRGQGGGGEGGGRGRGGEGGGNSGGGGGSGGSGGGRGGN